MQQSWLRVTAIVACFVAVTACSSQRLLIELNPEPDGHAWWLRTDFQPRGKSIRGIAVKAFQPQWCAANEITLEAFPESVRTGGQWSLNKMVSELGARFAMSGTFGSGEQLEVFLGAFNSCDGQRGIFLSVLAPGRGRGNDRIVQVEVLGSVPGFLYIEPDQDGGTFSIVSCFACDDLGQIYRWDANADKFIKREPYIHETG